MSFFLHYVYMSILFEPFIRTLLDASTPSQSEPVSDDNEGALRIPQSSSSRFLCLNQNIRWRGSYSFAEM